MNSWHLPDPHTQPEFYDDVPMKRLFAFVVDTILITVICVLLLPFTAFTALWFFPALMAVVGFLYRVITLANGSATLGMRLFSIEFRDATGARFSLGTAFLHTVGLNVSFAVAPLQLISIILMATSARGQGLSDMVLNTVAINRPARY